MDLLPQERRAIASEEDLILIHFVKVSRKFDTGVELIHVDLRSRPVYISCPEIDGAVELVGVNSHPWSIL
jgi:hypothetical protein